MDFSFSAAAILFIPNFGEAVIQILNCFSIDKDFFALFPI